ncbi:hypothetical protein H0H87_004497 [Tephrocybe sp. NHM501043]|nr:hypothetical protein H0H87_004497 [Tephrocybe sp. NHM501043]
MVRGANKPILRWLASPAHSPSATPPSPSLADLHEALHEPLPSPPPLARPPPARLPDLYRVRRGPPFLDRLARSTLPTAALSRPLHLSRTPSPTPPLVSASSTSSLDSLRSLSTGSRWWRAKDALLNQQDRAASPTAQHTKLCKKSPLAPADSAADRSPAHPVVFCHGLLGFDSVTIGPSIAPVHVSHWRGIKEVLEENGTEVLITRVPATSSPVDRAHVLERTISQVYPGRKVHLIGHSMGGLDCRYLASHLTHRNFDVLSITTIATPHRGSAFADHFLSTVGPTRMPSVLSLLDLLPNGGGDGSAFQSLTLDSMRKFNQDTPDVPGVRYFSWGAVYEPGLIDTWKWPHGVILEKEGPNDGLVSVESSKWGTYLGTLQHVNHLDLVGWINTARYKWAEMMGKEIKFRPATFYLGIADMLAGEVDGIPREGEEPQLEHRREHDDEVREGLSEIIGEGKADSGQRTPRQGDDLDEPPR